MAGNRKAFEKIILDLVEKILPGSDNPKMLRTWFDSMDDEQFEAMVEKLEAKKARIPIVVPNLGKHKLDLKRNFAIAREMGHDFYQRLWITPDDGGPKYLSNKKYMVIDLPIRRQAQLQEKKISIPEDSKSIDELTGQPTGKSKGSRLSYPETQILAALNLENTLVEMLKFRGGDIKGFNAMTTSISRTGGVSQKAIEPYAGGVKSTDTLRIMLTCMHLQNTLGGKR